MEGLMDWDSKLRNFVNTIACLSFKIFFLVRLLLTCYLVIPSFFDWSTTALQIDQVATKKKKKWRVDCQPGCPHKLHAHMLVRRPHHSSRTLNLLWVRNSLQGSGVLFHCPLYCVMMWLIWGGMGIWCTPFLGGVLEALLFFFFFLNSSLSFYKLNLASPDTFDVLSRFPLYIF